VGILWITSWVLFRKNQQDKLLKMIVAEGIKTWEKGERKKKKSYKREEQVVKKDK
jgi:hypothetical protein